MLSLKNTPGFAGDNLVMTRPQHKQVGQDRNADGFLTPVLIPTDLVLAQSQPRFQFPVDQLDRPTLLVDAHWADANWRSVVNLHIAEVG